MKDPRRRTTGEALEAALAVSGVSKRELARMTDVSRRTVQRIASGDREGYLDTWMRFAEALGCEVSDLTGEKDGEIGSERR